MKNIFQLFVLLVLMAGCSNDDHPDSTAQAGAEIPANEKFLEKIVGETQTITMGYDAEKRINNITYNNTRYEISYENGFVRKIRIHSGDRKGNYTFGHYPNGNISGCRVSDFDTDNTTGYIGIAYNAAANSYSDWMYMYPDGSVRKAIINDVEKVFIYDTTKKGGLANTNAEVLTYLMFVDRYNLLWPQFLGLLPSTQMVYPTGAVAIQNTYDDQGFIIKSHRDSPANNLDMIYSYIQL